MKKKRLQRFIRRAIRKELARRGYTPAQLRASGILAALSSSRAASAVMTADQMQASVENALAQERAAVQSMLNSLPDGSLN